MRVDDTPGKGYDLLIVEAAIIADIEHRGGAHLGDGCFQIPIHDEGVGVVVWDGGWTTLAGYRPHVESLPVEAPTPEEVSRLQSEVFDYWPGAIKTAFADLENLPSWFPFAAAGENLRAGRREIDIFVSSRGGGIQPRGNGRLAADLENLMADTAQLNGQYAAEFQDSYVAALPWVISSHHEVLRALAIGVIAEGQIWERCYNDVTELKAQAYEAMLGSRPQGGHGGGLALTIVGALASAAALFATGGLATAISLATIGARVAQDVFNETKSAKKTEDVVLGGARPLDVLTNIERAVTRIKEVIREQESDIVRILENCAEAMTGEKHGGNFDLVLSDAGSEPWLAPEQVITVNPTMIAKITNLWLPTIAHDITSARHGLDITNTDWFRNRSLGIGETGPYGSVDNLQRLIDQSLADLAKELGRAADKLESAARIIGKADENENTKYAARARLVNQQNINQVSY